MDERIVLARVLPAGARLPGSRGGALRPLADALASPDPERERLLAQALALRTVYWDTHPSLADRVAALGEPSPVLTPVARSAAAVLLGSALERLSRATERASSWGFQGVVQ